MFRTTILVAAMLLLLILILLLLLILILVLILVLILILILILILLLLPPHRQVGLLGERVIINPTRKELSQSQVNLVVVATSGGLCTMLEGESKSVSGALFLRCVTEGLDAGAEVARRIDELGGRQGRPVRRGEVTHQDPLLLDRLLVEVKRTTWPRLLSLYKDYTLNKLSRDRAMWGIFSDVTRKCLLDHPEWEADTVNWALSETSKAVVRHLVFAEGRRVDGRGLGDIRPISCEVGLHAPLHGSALFTRGQTQVLLLL